MSAIKYWLWLSTASKLSPRATAALLEHYGSAENMFFAPKGEISSLLGSRADGAQKLEERDTDEAMRIIDKCESQGIRIVTRQDAAYPERLRNIYSPPSIIYVKGELPDIDEEASIAVIGTRNASPYGIKMGRRLGYEITKCGGIVISGLTKGIDAAGAQGALSAGGKCIGVLGVPHELEKSRLSHEVVVRGGALISEYPPGTEAYRSHFRARNRIAAGLSVGVLVVEAPEKSGTRLFANEAAEQGKEIFAVPGNADAENCRGTNILLKEGAKPVTEGWDVMSEFEALYPAKVKKYIGQMPETEKKVHYSMNNEEDDSKKFTKKVIDKQESTAYIDLKKQLEDLSPSQLKIVEAMDKPSVHVDDIIERCGLPPAKVLADLTMLQLKGCVSQESGKRFTLNILKK